jgi:hypothetical protein
MAGDSRALASIDCHMMRAKPVNVIQAFLSVLVISYRV